MITEQEKQDIINAAVEQVLLMLPSAIGNLITNHISMVKVNREFYAKHPEFKKHSDIVAATIEDIEGANTFSDYRKILEESVPKIKENIKLKLGLDMKTVSKPEPGTDLGEL